jgi:hypothetical protein
MARGGKTVITVKTEAPRPRRKLPPPPKIHRDKKGDYQRRQVRSGDGGE